MLDVDEVLLLEIGLLLTVGAAIDDALFVLLLFILLEPMPPLEELREDELGEVPGVQTVFVRVATEVLQICE